MNRLSQVAMFALAIAATGASALATPKAPLPKPKLSKVQAAAIAMKAFKRGTIVASELEAEKGGSGLRYSFDVRDGAATREIGIDANTGAVLENAREGRHPD